MVCSINRFHGIVRSQSNFITQQAQIVSFDNIRSLEKGLMLFCQIIIQLRDVTGNDLDYNVSH
jgi:hypothetical protein